MSLLISTDVSCDGDCSQWTEGTTGMRTDARTARKAAKRAGWIHLRGRDYCPRCAEGQTDKGKEHHGSQSD